MGKDLLDPISMFAGEKDVGDDYDGGQGPGISIRANTKTTQKEIPAVYGEVRVGGNLPYIGTAGANNNDLWVVQSLSEGECDSIAQDGGVDQVFLDDKLWNEYGGLVSYYFHAGTPSQAKDSNLFAALAEHTDEYHFLCYMVFRCVYDGDFFQSIPDFQTILKGRKILDFRTATTAWSNNPVLCLHDFITAVRFGPGLATSKIDYPSWIAAANYCDEKEFTYNNVIAKNQGVGLILDEMRAHFRGRLNWFDGKYSLRYADLNYEAVAMNLTDEHLFEAGDGSLAVSIAEPSIFTLPDGITVKWRDPDNGFVEDDLPIGDEVGVIKTVNLLGCTNREMAGKLGVYHLERALLNRTLSSTLRQDAVRLEPWDIVKATWPAFGLTNQYLRVQDVILNKEGIIETSFAYESLALYDDIFNLVVADAYQCTLPDPQSVPGDVTGVSLSEQLYDYRLQTYTRLNVTATGPAHEFFIGVNVWKSLDDVNYDHYGFVEGSPGGSVDFSLDPVEEGVTYYLIMTSVSLHGPEQTLAGGYKASRLIQGLTALPASLTEIFAIANDNTVSVYGQKLNNPDIEIYEFRLGGWTGGIFLASLRSPNLNLQGVKPGDHLFYANTLSTNGLYGEFARSASTALIDPPKGWSVQATDLCDYNGVGVHKNTEWVDYVSDDYLKCSHDGFITNTGDLDLYVAGDYERAQAFVPFLNIDALNSLQLYLKKTGSPTGNLKAYIYDDSSGPDTLLATSDNFDVSTLTGSLAWISFTFSTPPALVKGTKYYVVIDGADITQTGANYVEWGYDSAGSWGTNAWYNSGGGWTEISGDDMNFKIDIYTGRYLSPEYDRSASGTYLVYLLADTVVTGAAVTWGGIIPSPDTWDDIGITYRTWNEIFALDEAPEVHIKVYWGDISGTLSNSAEKLEILSTVVTGRYYQFEITIRDPSSAVEILVENFTAKYCQ